MASRRLIFYFVCCFMAHRDTGVREQVQEPGPVKVDRRVVLDLVEEQAQADLGQHVVQLRRVGIAENVHDLLLNIFHLQNKKRGGLRRRGEGRVRTHSAEAKLRKQALPSTNGALRPG